MLTLRDDAGRVVEATSHNVGFREVEIRGGQLLVNGKAIYIKDTTYGTSRRCL